MSFDKCDYVKSLVCLSVFFPFTLRCNFVQLRQLLCFPLSFFTAFICLLSVNCSVYCLSLIMIIDGFHCMPFVVYLLCNCSESICIVFVMYRFMYIPSVVCLVCVCIAFVLQLASIVFVQLSFHATRVCSLSRVLVYVSCSRYT